MLFIFAFKISTSLKSTLEKHFIVTTNQNGRVSSLKPFACEKSLDWKKKMIKMLRYRKKRTIYKNRLEKQ